MQKGFLLLWLALGSSLAAWGAHGAQVDQVRRRKEEADRSRNQKTAHRLRRQSDPVDPMEGTLFPGVDSTEHGAPQNNQLGSRLRIVRLFAPEAVQNRSENATLDCMFNFDRKLDQRLTIKWFFEDELEPIYEWIPELNKRVFSDKYERFLDKDYEVGQDTDYLLQAYKQLLASHSDSAGSSDQLQEAQQAGLQQQQQLDRQRRLLAARLAKLAKLGAKQSRQLLDALRYSLNMDRPEFSRFRALRLLRPGEQLSGRFTCSVSSLDGQDLRSTRLIVYEPAKRLSFQASRLSAHLFNLTCKAEGAFPEPALRLFRLKPGPPAPQLGQSHAARAEGAQGPARPRLAATQLRPELMQEARVQVSQQVDSDEQVTYEALAWAPVDESSLSSTVNTQFECQLALEGTPYESRQSLVLQRGWHVNSGALSARQTLVGLFSALASILCLMLALVSSLLIFRLLKRHARNRVQQLKGPPTGNNLLPSATISNTNNKTSYSNNTDEDSNSTSCSNMSNQNSVPTEPDCMNGLPNQAFSQPIRTISSSNNNNNNNWYAMGSSFVQTNQPTFESDGVYRVPETAQLGGTRFIIGPGVNRAQYSYTSSSNQIQSLEADLRRNRAAYLSTTQQPLPSLGSINETSSGANKPPLYC